MLVDLQRALVRALEAPDPVAALARERAGLPEPDREALAHVDPDGFRLTALLVRKLRFERLCRGDARVAAWFHDDPQAFVEAFRAFRAAVPPTAYLPSEEAAAFVAWRAARVPADRRQPSDSAE